MVPKISTRKIWEAAIWRAAGMEVDVMKQSCAPRCIMTTSDTPQARRLIEDYNNGKALDIPQKSIVDAYIAIVGACRALQGGRIGGVVG